MFMSQYTSSVRPSVCLSVLLKM